MNRFSFHSGTLAFTALFSAPLFIGASCGDAPLSIGAATGASGASGEAGSPAATCPTSACGPALGLANSRCADGTIAGPTGRCLAGEGDACHWEVITCGGSEGGASGAAGAPACGPNACTGPEPKIASGICPDGSISGPVCAAEDNGTCGWQIRTCPAGGAGSGGGAGAAGSGGDPCAGQSFPACVACAADPYSQLNGSACSTPGTYCGDSIGDGCTCQNGKTWACAPHPPLGGPGVCNKVCDETGGGGAGGAAGAGGGTTDPCASLLADARVKLAAAQACNNRGGSPVAQCQGAIEGFCCPVLVENPSSDAARSYLDALHAYETQCKQECSIEAACFVTTPGDCEQPKSGGSGVCGGGTGYL